MGEQVGLLDVEPLAARVRDHVGVGVDPARLDPGVAEQREQLAAAAADVEHRARASRKSSTYGRWRSRTSSVEPRMRLSKAK